MSDEWYEQQLSAVGLDASSDSGDDRVVYFQVRQLLDVFNQQGHPTPESAERVLKVFDKLARSQPLKDKADPEMWVQVQLGAISKGSTVRVKDDAFNGEHAWMHNGREGVIVDGRRGDVIVDLRDDGPEIKGFHYRADQLEQRV